MTMFFRWCLIALSFGLVNCAHSEDIVRPAGLEQLKKPKSIRLGGTVIRQFEDKLVGSDVYNAEYLFHLAGEAEREDDFSRALALYRRLIEEFQAGIYYAPALFNSGLLLEGEKKYDEAAESYSTLVKLTRPSDEKAERTWLLAHFRLAVCFGELGQWWKAVGIFDFVLELEDLSQFNQFEAMVGRGISIHEAEDTEGAEIALSGAFRFFRKMPAARQRRGMDLVSEATFRLGEIARSRFSQIALAYPIEVLRERLEDKCVELLSAQGRYLRAMRYGSPPMVAAAGYQVGSLYETLYDEIMTLETPEGLDEVQAQIYWEEVRSRVNILVKKAIRIYEKALLVGKRGSSEKWMSRLERSLNRLKTIYLETSSG